MNKKVFFLVLSVMLTGSGCYTRFGSMQQPGPQYYSVPEADSLSGGDPIDDSASARSGVAVQVDTIVYKEKEICIWDRDFMGMPYLRCFPSNYNQDWFYYNSSPWWFRSSAYYWYDYKRCPRYYYYDQSCGSCRYYQHHPYRSSRHDTGGGDRFGSGSGGMPNRSRSIGGAASRPSSGSSSGSSYTSPPSQSGRSNKSGVGIVESMPKPPANQTTGNAMPKQAESVEPVAPAPQAPSVAPSPPPSGKTQQRPEASNDNQKNRSKRNARW